MTQITFPFNFEKEVDPSSLQRFAAEHSFEWVIQQTLLNLPIPEVLLGFHWHCESETPGSAQAFERLEFEKDKPVYVCDRSYDWNISAKVEQTLYMVLFKPGLIDYYIGDGHISERYDALQLKVEAGEIGSFINCPTPDGREPYLRELAITNPKEQIIQIKKIGTLPKKEDPPRVINSVVTNPNQPTCFDPHGVLRFKENAIVRFLLDYTTPRGLGMNELCGMGFSQDDWKQFAQLIGYSVSGWGGLSYVTPTDVEIVDRMISTGKTEESIKVDCYADILERLRSNIRKATELLDSAEYA